MNFDIKPATLTECDREPIHTISAVQDFGGLIAVNLEWVVARRSLNAAQILGSGDLPAIGSQLADHFTPKAMDTLKSALGQSSNEDAVERIFGLRLTQGGALCDCAIHQSSGSIIIEFERHAADEYANHIALIGPTLSQLEPLKDLNTLFSRTASIVRQMLGYDRVMVYQFHPDESGEVVAEDRRSAANDLMPSESRLFIYACTSTLSPITTSVKFLTVDLVIVFFSLLGSCDPVLFGLICVTRDLGRSLLRRFQLYKGGTKKAKRKR